MRRKLNIAWIMAITILLNLNCGKKASFQKKPDGNDNKNQISAIRSDGENKLEPLSPSITEEFVIDPFCGMRLRKKEATGPFVYKGKSYYFCSRDHLEAFKQNPEIYLTVDSGS